MPLPEPPDTDVDPSPSGEIEDGAEPESAAVVWVRRNMSYFVLAGVLIAFILPRVPQLDWLNSYTNVFQRFSEWLLAKLEALFKDYGYYVVFFGVLAENSLFLGLLVPGSVILILGGLSAQNGAINLWFVLALAVVATMIGDTLSYYAGRLGWTNAIERFGMRKLLEKVRGPMESKSTWLILGYHFAGYSRLVGPPAAGLFGISYRRWAPLDYAGGTLWVLVYTMAGVLLGVAGVEFGDTKQLARLLEFFFTGVIIIAIVLTIWRSRKPAGGDGPPPRSRGRAVPVVIPVNED